jgi:NADPH-dependent glutamate synthase beta subunit-like oxidoreductase
MNDQPAAQEEIDDANREGVEIQGQLQPVEVVTDGNGRAVALRMIRLEEDGSTPIEGSEFDIECELIVSAIGQGVDAEGMDDSFFNLNQSKKHQLYYALFGCYQKGSHQYYQLQCLLVQSQ